MKSYLVKIFSLFVLAALLSGCPKFAYVNIYNNTAVELTVDSSGLILKVSPGEAEKFRFTGNKLVINSNLGSWIYPRRIPHGGNDGHYFNGTLHVQINQDGRILALPVGQVAPVKEVPRQPVGYPIYPVSE